MIKRLLLLGLLGFLIVGCKRLSPPTLLDIDTVFVKSRLHCGYDSISLYKVTETWSDTIDAYYLELAWWHDAWGNIKGSVSGTQIFVIPFDDSIRRYLKPLPKYRRQLP